MRGRKVSGDNWRGQVLVSRGETNTQSENCKNLSQIHTLTFGPNNKLQQLSQENQTDRNAGQWVCEATKTKSSCYVKVNLSYVSSF